MVRKSKKLPRHLIVYRTSAMGDVAMLADALPPGHGEYREVFTSGSSGMPIRAVRSQLWELVWSAFTIRDHLWHRRDLTGTLAVIRESGADLVLGYTIKPCIWGSLAAKAEGVESASLVTGLGYAFVPGKGLVRRMVGTVSRGLWRRATAANRVVIFQNPLI